MEAFALYFLKSAIWLTGIALVYFLFLKDERFFLLKRIYLIAGILISFIFPLVTIHYQVELPAPVTDTPDIAKLSQGLVNSAQQAIPERTFDYKYILLFLYLAGIFFLVFKLIKQSVVLLGKIREAGIGRSDRTKIIRASEVTGSFSFFNYVFINPSLNETELKMIINHELVHVHQKHWFDLLLVELLRLFQWVNPFAWIYTGFIKQNHEFIADEVALQQSFDPAVYRAVLVNQMLGTKVISLSNSFNYSVNKNRFDMMKKIVTSPYRKMKILLVLPVFAFVFYAFATPEYKYSAPSENKNKIDSTSSAVNNIFTNYDQVLITDQKTVKGIVLKEDGKPLAEVNITSTGTIGNAYFATTGLDGRFEIKNVQPDASLLFSCRGYKGLSLKPVFTSDMTVKMEKDADYKPPVAQQDTKSNAIQRQGPLVVIDGIVTEKYYSDAVKELGYNMGIIKNIFGKEATDKYGEKGVNGVMEITTRKKALEMGLKPPFPRISPDDYPTFQGQSYLSFNDWVGEHVKYPAEARAKNLNGWVQVNFIVELDGSISDIKPVGTVDPILSDEVIRVIKTSPKWERPKNPAVDMPFNSSVNIGFKYPDMINKEAPFVVVEQMPQYPGGEGEILKFIATNTKYPEEAIAKKIQGKVIVRFIVNTDGNVEGLTVLKGVDPLLDNEALRVVGMLSGFQPGMQGGKAVNVWYMVPVNFALAEDKP